MAFPSNAVLVGEDIFISEQLQRLLDQLLEGQSFSVEQLLIKKHFSMDLQRLFGTDERIVRELRHRFVKLPVHSVVYYQSYHEGVLQRLIELDPTGNQQDCLGMTPLHILTCSSVHNLELYLLL